MRNCRRSVRRPRLCFTGACFFEFLTIDQLVVDVFINGTNNRVEVGAQASVRCCSAAGLPVSASRPLAKLHSSTHAASSTT